MAQDAAAGNHAVAYCQPWVASDDETEVVHYSLHAGQDDCQKFCVQHRAKIANAVPQKDGLYIVDPAAVDAETIATLSYGGAVLVYRNDLPPKAQLH